MTSHSTGLKKSLSLGEQEKEELENSHFDKNYYGLSDLSLAVTAAVLGFALKLLKLIINVLKGEL